MACSCKAKLQMNICVESNILEISPKVISCVAGPQEPHVILRHTKEKLAPCGGQEGSREDNIRQKVSEYPVDLSLVPDA